MNLQAQRDISIAGDVVGRDKIEFGSITINITRGLDELPTRYDNFDYKVWNCWKYVLEKIRGNQ